MASDTDTRQGPPAVQDHYPEDVAHCFGCGRLKQKGHQLKTFWEGDETLSADGVVTARAHVVAVRMPEAVDSLGISSSGCSPR